MPRINSQPTANTIVNNSHFFMLSVLENQKQKFIETR